MTNENIFIKTLGLGLKIMVGRDTGRHNIILFWPNLKCSALKTSSIYGQ